MPESEPGAFRVSVFDTVDQYRDWVNEGDGRRDLAAIVSVGTSHDGRIVLTWRAHAKARGTGKVVVG